MQKTVRNALNSYAKNSAKCVKFTCKKQCEMRQIHMQKTMRNAANLCSKNSAKCGKLICKKQCDMRNEFRGVFCIEIWRIFEKNLQKVVWQFSIFSSFFMMIFNDNVCRDGIGWDGL